MFEKRSWKREKTMHFMKKGEKMQNFPCDCAVDAAKMILEAICRERNRDETCVDTEMSRRFVDGEGAC